MSCLRSWRTQCAWPCGRQSASKLTARPRWSVAARQLCTAPQTFCPNNSSNPQQVATNDIESGTSGLAKELRKAVLWALVEDALGLLRKHAKPLVVEAAQDVAVTADRLGVFAAQKLQAAAKTVRNGAPRPESLCLGAGYLFLDMNPQRKKMIGSLEPKTRTQMTKR